jgi:hypothetical protein
MTYKTTLTTRVVHERATLSQQLQIHLARKYTAHRVVEHVQREDIYMSKYGILGITSIYSRYKLQLALLFPFVSNESFTGSRSYVLGI